MLQAVIFDLDGTLVDSEQYGHRVAFNDAFEAFGLPDRWTPERYRDLLAITGGERRLFAWLSGPESSCAERPEAARREMAAALHRWKTSRVQDMAASGSIPARDGVGDWLKELNARGIRLGVATTGSRQWAIPLLDKVFGRDRFEVVVAGDDVARRKPDPEAYELALARLGLDRAAAMAVEDSGPGWESARDARLACVVVANDETDLATVAGAPLILDGFGPSARIIEDRFAVMNSDSNTHPSPTDVLAQLLARATIET
jgi:HAD superfamily hydrolase (TIGR01509 family)